MGKEFGYLAHITLCGTVSKLKEVLQLSEVNARVINYPKRKDTLTNGIENAFQARNSKAHFIVSPRDRFGHNSTCT